MNPGSVLNRYDTSTAGGKIRIGYADANEINGVIANLVFRTPGDEVEETDLIPVRGGKMEPPLPVPRKP